MAGIIQRCRSEEYVPIIADIAKEEQVSYDFIKNGLVQGTIVIPHNMHRIVARPCAIGKGLKTKVNVNIGVSPGFSSLDDELQKLRKIWRIRTTSSNKKK